MRRRPGPLPGRRSRWPGPEKAVASRPPRRFRGATLLPGDSRRRRRSGACGWTARARTHASEAPAPRAPRRLQPDAKRAFEDDRRGGGSPVTSEAPPKWCAPLPAGIRSRSWSGHSSPGVPLARVKILIVSPRMPTPGGKGDQIRAFQFAQALAPQHSVQVLDRRRGRQLAGRFCAGGNPGERSLAALTCSRWSRRAAARAAGPGRLDDAAAGMARGPPAERGL